MNAQLDHAARPLQALSAPRAHPPRRSSVPIHHARGHMYGTLARTTRPRPATSVSAWSDRYRVLTSKSSGEAGPWRTDRVPFAREIMDCLSTHHPAQRIVLKFATQMTKTELALNWLGYIIDHAPAPTLVVLPTLEVRKRWVRQRLDPLLNETPQIRRVFDGRRKRDAGNSEDLKDYPGGMLVISGANSPASLASMPIKYVVCDEVDRFPWEAGEEGDPLGLIDERTKTFPRRKVLLVSTPTTAGTSRIDDEYQASDRREFEVPCPHCGHHQVLYWTRPDGEPGLIRNAATGAVYYRCANSACGERIDERHKPGMLAAGRWVPRDPGKSARGYHINALYAPIGLGFSWAELWDKWEDARGDTAKLKRFINTSLGEVWVEQGESLDTLSLIGRLEDYGEFPARLRTAGVDVQKDRLEVTLVDWTAGEEAWTRDHLILPGDTALPEVWDELAEVLREARTDFAGIDSGYNTSMVYDFCEAAGVWCFALKGMDGPGRPIVEDERRIRQRYRARRKRAAPLYVVGVDQAKALLYARMKLRQVGPGYVHFPRAPAFDDEYFAQLGAEKLVTKVHGNRAFAEWVKTRSRNEALDCYVYALAALRLSGKDPADYADKTRAELLSDRSDAAVAGEDAADSIFAPISMT